MKVVTQRVQGKLLQEDGRAALLLLNVEPTAEQTADSLYLRFAFVLRGVETSIFPAELLDDWGNSVKGWALYEWVLEYVDQFPRAEIFGFERNGRETQCFLRDLEVVEAVRCYAYSNKEMPLADGVLVEAILLPTAGVTSPEKIERPRIEGKRPLSAAKASWWQAPPETNNLSSVPKT
jgi:hypothetical protein